MGYEEEITVIIDGLSELTKDLNIPKNVKDKIENTINALKQDTDVSIKVHKALNELDEVIDDINLQPYTRTQIWNIVSLLEKIVS